MLLILLARPLFKVLSICVCLLIKDNINAFEISCSLCSARSCISCYRTFTVSEHKKRRSVWFAVSIKAKFESFLPFILVTSLLLYLDCLTSLFSIGFTVVELK
jgi:hypothetical protein